MPEVEVTQEVKEIPLDQQDYQTFKQNRAGKETPAEPPKEEPKAEAVSETAKPDDEIEVEEKPKFKGGFQKKIDKLTREKYEAIERENALLKKLAERGEPLAPKAVEAVKAKPKVDDFNTYEEYVESLADWKAEQKYRDLSAKENETAEQEVQQAQLQERFDAHVKRVEAAREKYTDYDQVVESIEAENDELPEGVALTIVELENGPDVAYHLAKNPEILSKLREMSSYRAIAEIGKIADKLAGTAEPKEPPKPKSAAPAPIKPVSTGATKSAVPLDEMSYSDYKKARASGRTV